MPATSAMEKPTLDLLRLRDAVRSYAMTPLLFEPDSRYQYANAGINTAGRIIEVMSGMPYETFLDRRLFEPLGMQDTTFWPDEKQIARLAKSYKPASDATALVETPVTQLMYPLNDRSRQPMPAGGLFSTAADLTRFCQMILGGGVYKGKRYLSEAAVKQMTAVETGEIRLNNRDLEGYVFGWVVMKRAAADGRDAGSFGHRGAYKTMMWIDPGKDQIVMLLRQQAGNDGNKVEPAFLSAATRRHAN